MAEINKEYRETEGPTDVLSFAMWENEEGAFEPPADWESLPLGDIVVCPEAVAKNAAENGKSVESETVLVICHGFLAPHRLRPRRRGRARRYVGAAGAHGQGVFRRIT